GPVGAGATSRSRPTGARTWPYRRARRRGGAPAPTGPGGRAIQHPGHAPPPRLSSSPHEMRRHSPHVASIEQALAELRAGRMIILMDDEDRENEGDLCVAAERVTAEHINFMATHGRGLICLSVTETQCERLGLSMMVSENRAPLGTAFTVS